MCGQPGCSDRPGWAGSLLLDSGEAWVPQWPGGPATQRSGRARTTAKGPPSRGAPMGSCRFFELPRSRQAPSSHPAASRHTTTARPLTGNNFGMPKFGPRRDYVPTRNSANVVITPKGANKPVRRGIRNKFEPATARTRSDRVGKAEKRKPNGQPRSNRGPETETDLVRLEPRRSRKAESHRRKSEPRGSDRVGNATPKGSARRAW